MRSSWILTIAGVATASPILSACSGALPVVDLKFSDPAVFRGYVEAIVRHVGCELGQAVQVEYSPAYPETYDLRKWAARIVLTIRAKDTISFGASSSLFNTLSTGIFSIGLGSQSDSSRELVITYFATFDELLKKNYPRQADGITFVPCDEFEQLPSDRNRYSAEYLKRPIAGNLGIGLTLKSAMETWTTPGLLTASIEKGPFETVTHHVTFEVRLNANANPSLKFANVSANVGGKLLDSTRIDTNELQVTMGPLALGTRKAIPSKALDDSFYVERLKSAIRRDN